MTTGTIFGLLVLVHLWRMTAEPHLVRDPWYWLITGVAAAFCIWAWRLVLTTRRVSTP